MENLYKALLSWYAMEKEYLVCIGVHAEKLNADSVWNETLKALDIAERFSIKMTFLVHPLYSILEGKDISNRLKEIHDRGHEIGQHTHFYLNHPEGRFEKKTDLSPENILYCLRRDNTFLNEAGFKVKGFCGGAWVITNSVLQELGKLGFSYDCTARSFDLSYKSDIPNTTIISKKPFISEDGLLEIPTTAPIRFFLLRQLTFRETKLRYKRLSYDIIYFHDYDLVDFKKRLLFMLVTKFLGSKKGKSVTVGELEKRLRRLI
jgi:peptidoglycan/xylan/chitin deacetylase (PgdA/CDA1 family)